MASAISIDQWADVEVTPSTSSGVATFTVDVDTTPYSAEDLLYAAGIVNAGQMNVSVMMQMCTTSAPTSGLDCTSTAVTSQTVATSSPSVMSIVLNYNQSQLDSFVSGAISQGYSHQLLQVRLIRSGNTSHTYYYQVGQSSSNQTTQAQTPAPYSGPRLEIVDPIRAAGKVTITGKKLDQISSIQISGNTIQFKTNAATEIELTIPADLAPGKYDLEITSSSGRLIQYGAITIKAPTQAANFSLKGSGSKVDAYMLTELSNIGSMFNSDYKKITCVANAADAATAQAVADKVCKTLKAGELRSATTRSVAKSTFKGEGYWVRVYLAG